MRIGYNPHKDKELEPNDFFHQVIIPVYIPNELDYFKDSISIFKYAIQSVIKTSHPKTFITIINNGSCPELVIYVEELLKTKQINELIHTTNIGKLNAILKGLSGHNFPYITISDADVLFLNDWQKATYDIFESFSKAGVVSPVPNSRGLRYHTSNIFFEYFFSKKLKFTEVINPKAMKKFAISIGNENFYNEINLKKYLTISNNKGKAVVGAGHFVATYKGEIFESLNQKFSPYSLGGNSEEEILDKPAVNKGYWRLSTQDNFAYHMGNVAEDWMKKELSNLSENNVNTMIQVTKKIKTNKVTNLIKNRFLSKIILRHPFWLVFLYLKGLKKNELKQYNK